MSKGSGRRPLKVAKEEFESNWDRIFGRGKDDESKQVVDVGDDRGSGEAGDEVGNLKPVHAGSGSGSS